MAIEFSRNITFGQYLDLRSPIHRLDPRVKIVGVALIMFGLLVARNFYGLGVAFAGAALVQVAARIPLGFTLRGMRLLFNTMLIVFTFQLLFFPNPSDPWWQWGIVSLSWDGVYQGLLILARVLLLYYFTSTLMFTTGLMDLADGVEIMLDPLKRLRVPVNELVMTFVISLKFVPLLVAELERLVKARAARGERFDQGGFIERGRRVGQVLIPLFVNALGRAEVLTTAMNARCYRGGQGRTKRRVLTMAGADWLAMLVALLIAAGTILLGRVLL
ncbi:MAG TPA: energy-coupling factor transporter transmembrane component T [Chloroflexaceae bacterium]|nr:energy-coupling factor transporter transmembrane component T [Chloroflexaceae bacterium]